VRPNSWNTVLQTSHNKPLSDENISENVNSIYSTKIGNRRVPLAVCEMKRNLITPHDWQTGDISSKGSQKKLSQELRGYDTYCHQVCNTAKFDSYAHKYRCPQIFCFDGQTLLLLRWCQGMSATGQLTVGELREHSRETFSGRPVWRVNGVSFGGHPGDYQRSVDSATGSLRWTHEEYPDVTAETLPFWGGEPTQGANGQAFLHVGRLTCTLAGKAVDVDGDMVAT
jgi:hypothetical protein